MSEDWQEIDTAPKDGRPVHVKRVHGGEVVFEGEGAWRRVHFEELRDPISNKIFAEAYDGEGWMHPKIDKRIPEPTHWKR